jgi:hypothetical protein
MCHTLRTSGIQVRLYEAVILLEDMELSLALHPNFNEQALGSSK